MAKSKENVDIKITSAIVVDGEVVKAGSEITVSDALARNLLHRGKAEVLTEDNAKGKPKGKAKADAEGDDKKA
ncbi:hypothetical protein GCM10016455_05570 [Aliiroseovarius zhejiangensis]|uniref:50S ribosomal protein L6 n=1 Tax=Aliiroseovarius zhejiangensis TaxID=1632025 RepID=A0ABQ3IS44_9RHOB|nr:hypothetical protein [Aliiroseovarius zhejiangensis]GHE88322.1 hypothetical protein GCM10016455_05570 [Aliiroseovarius zhejiangensis]